MNRGGLDDFIVDIEEKKGREGKGSRDVFIGRFLLYDVLARMMLCLIDWGGYFCRRVCLCLVVFFLFS